MAIEAAKQVAEPGRIIDGFNAQEVKFHAAMRVPNNAHGLESSLYLRPVKGLESKSSSWFEFRVCTYENEAWTENCTGILQIMYAPNDADSNIEKRHKEELWNNQLQGYSEAVTACTLPVNGSSLYERLQKSGYGYGEAFQLVKCVSLGPQQSQVLADVQMFSSSAGETIHPTTLDAILQTSIWTTVDAEAEEIPTAIPTSIDSLWVSSRFLQTPSSNLLKTYATKSEESTFLGASVDIVALDEPLVQALVSVQGLGTSIVSEPESVQNAVATTGEICHRFEWKPDPNLLSKTDLRDLCTQGACDVSNLADEYRDLDFVIMSRVIETLQALSEQAIHFSKPHLQKYVDWMKHQQSLLAEPSFWLSDETWKARLADSSYVREVESRVMSRNNRGALFVTFGRDLLKLLAGETAPSDNLLQSEKMKELYMEEVGLVLHIRVLANHINSSMSRLASSISTAILTFWLIPIPG